MAEHEHDWGGLHQVAREADGEPILVRLCMVDGCAEYLEFRRGARVCTVCEEGEPHEPHR